MSVQLMTADDVERYIGTKVDKYEWQRGVYIAASSIRTALAMAGVGGKLAGAAGLSTGAGVLLTGAAAVLAPFAALAAALCAIGIPAFDAKIYVRNKAAKHGYAIGTALGMFNHSKYYMSTFLDNTSGSPGVAPKYMTGVYKKAFNATLILGYSSALKLKETDKKAFREMVLQVMIDDARRKGYRLNTAAWTERDGVYHWARTLNTRITR